MNKQIYWKFIWKELCNQRGNPYLPEEEFIKLKKRFDYFWSKFALHENQEISNDYIPKITKEEERRKLKRLIKRKKRLIKY